MLTCWSLPFFVWVSIFNHHLSMAAEICAYWTPLVIELNLVSQVVNHTSDLLSYKKVPTFSMSSSVDLLRRDVPFSLVWLSFAKGGQNSVKKFLPIIFVNELMVPFNVSQIFRHFYSPTPYTGNFRMFIQLMFMFLIFPGKGNFPQLHVRPLFLLITISIFFKLPLALHHIY